MRSFRAKLSLAVAAVTGLIFLNLGGMIDSLTSESLRGDIDLMLRDKAFQLSRAGDVASGFRGTYVTEAQMEAGSRLILAQYHNADGEPRYKSARLPEPLPLTPAARVAVEHRSRWFVETAQLSNGAPVRVATVAITQRKPGQQEQATIGYAQAGVTFDDIDARVRHMRRWLILGGTLAVLLAGAAAWFIAGYWVRAVDQMTANAAQSQKSNSLQHRLFVPTNAPELARLSESLNSLLERLGAVHESQQRFVADAAHELRTPLSALRAEIDVALRRQRSESEYQRTLEFNRLEIERLGGLVENLLALASLDSGRAQPHRAGVNVAAVCRDAVEELAPLAAEKKVPVELEVPDELMVRGDVLALERAVRNLVENALRHTPTGEKIVVRATNGQAEARVDVIDAGVGIAPEHLPRLFERFYRIDTARNRAHGGAGLGLSIVKAIAEAHGGRVEVQSMIGAGSMFTIHLPLSHGAEPETAS